MDVYKYVNKTASTIIIDDISILPFNQYVSNVTVPSLDMLEGILLDKYVNGASVFNKVEFNSDSPVLSAANTGGIRLDTSNPRYGWNDLLSSTSVDIDNAADRPGMEEIVTGIKEYKFALNDLAYYEYHIPHDYLMGSNTYIHVHWTHNGVVVSGSVTWELKITYARGYSRGVFNSPVTLNLTDTVPITALTHVITEVQLSSPGGSGGLLDTLLLEPDGIIKTRLKLITNTSGVDPFCLFCDVHYQSTGIPTVNRNYNFWN